MAEHPSSLSVRWLLQEAMRLFPVTGDGTNRITTKDTRIGRYLIPKDTMVWVPFSAAFNSPHNFSRVNDYIPVSLKTILCCSLQARKMLSRDPA